MSTTKAGLEKYCGREDAKLIDEFIYRHNEAAFEMLMRRNGPMVMGICQRMLNDPQAAEDAFQATFLLLLQKCRSLKKPEQLANWLYGVAYRVATRMKAKAAGRRECNMLEADVPVSDSSVDAAWREVRSVFDQEVHRLSEQHRLPLVLCYLQGKTHLEAARELGWPLGSMSGRLAKARQVLRERLTRRGISLSSTLLVLLLAGKAKGANLSQALLSATTREAVSIASVASQSVDAIPAADLPAATIPKPLRRLIYSGGGVLVLLLLVSIATNVSSTRQPASSRTRSDNLTHHRTVGREQEPVYLVNSPDFAGRSTMGAGGASDQRKTRTQVFYPTAVCADP